MGYTGALDQVLRHDRFKDVYEIRLSKMTPE